MTDGTFTEKAWTEKSSIQSFGDSIFIYLINTEDYLYVGTKSNTKYETYTDLYFEFDQGKTLNLHGSFQLGERITINVPMTESYPPWQWGNNKHWIANRVTQDPAKKELGFPENIYPFEGQEFQIHKSKIESEFKLRIDIQDFLGERSPLVYNFELSLE